MSWYRPSDEDVEDLTSELVSSVGRFVSDVLGPGVESVAFLDDMFISLSSLSASSSVRTGGLRAFKETLPRSQVPEEADSESSRWFLVLSCGTALASVEEEASILNECVYVWLV